jgi:hypothetical protein
MVPLSYIAGKRGSGENGSSYISSKPITLSGNKKPFSTAELQAVRQNNTVTIKIIVFFIVFACGTVNRKHSFSLPLFMET